MYQLNRSCYLLMSYICAFRIFCVRNCAYVCFYPPAAGALCFHCPSRCPVVRPDVCPVGRSALVVGQSRWLSVRVSPILCQHGLGRWRTSSFLWKNGIIRRPGKFIIDAAAGGLQLSRLFHDTLLCFVTGVCVCHIMRMFDAFVV